MARIRDHTENMLLQNRNAIKIKSNFKKDIKVFGKQQLRKTLRVMPPVSRSIEESSLHPEIIQDYFKRFNKEYVKHRQDNEFKNQIGKKKPLNGLAELKKRFC